MGCHIICFYVFISKATEREVKDVELLCQNISCLIVKVKDLRFSL